jgi:asparagine synthase (glutamine-hydrolysing)
MCGICGYFGAHEGLTEERLRQMNTAIRRRGPDDEGYFVAPGIGLAMRRLSILDLHGGHQPIFNEDGTVCVVFNGEIYNFREVREELEAKGHRFSTHSDTEVLVHLYEEHGTELVHRLRGMFAFAIWDSAKQRLLIARDRVGIKPLFFAESAGTLVFGSEIKCLLECPWLDTGIDPQAVDAFFAYTYIPAPHTIFRGIRKLPPGHLLVADASGTRIEQYWDVDFSRIDRRRSEREWLEAFDAGIRDAVQSHLVSDVPLGAFLSGGIDSGLVTAMMSGNAEEPVKTFTMGFGGSSVPLIDERPYARALAEQYGFDSREFTVVPDFSGIVDEIVEAFDEPFADDSVVPSYYISQLTRREVKVALSGLGGDELFGGYHRYRGLYLSKYYALLPAPLHKHVIDPIVQRLPEPASGGDRIDHLKRFSRAAALDPAHRYLGYVSTMTREERRRLYEPDFAASIDFDYTDSLITSHFERCASDDIVDRMLYTDMKTYLPDDILALSDRLSMWHSLELRVPLVDHRLVELAATLPSHYKVGSRGLKILLKRLARQFLPASLIDHRKQGFESPMAAWLRHDLVDYTDSLLARPTTILSRSFLNERWREHREGKRKNNKVIFSFLMFNLWARRYGH